MFTSRVHMYGRVHMFTSRVAYGLLRMGHGERCHRKTSLYCELTTNVKNVQVTIQMPFRSKADVAHASAVP